ncbi:GNAT family N-acetyltransferase [Microbacterium sp. NPDC058345]|uniref:GNAT family N-acetyltransferase n=1 Tax=Microbacterium sp. NPDC058345 TaxID=3346455 RepID=UPI0036676A22
MATTLEAEATRRAANNAALITEMTASDHTENPSDYELTIVNDAERGRWIAVLGAEGIGELTYRYVGGRVVLLKAWVDHSYRNHGVASELVAYALDEITRMGKKITIICPVVGTFISQHPEFADLIDARHPGSGASPAMPEAAPRDDESEIAEFEKDIH